MLRHLDELRSLLSLHPHLDEQINRLVVVREFRRGDHFDSVSELRHQSMFIIQGGARLYFVRNGREHTYSVAFDGEFLTVFQSLLENPAAATSVEFLETSKVAFMPMDKLHELLRATPPDLFGSFAEVTIKTLLAYSLVLEERLILFQTCTAAERYHWLLNRYPGINKRLNATQMASLLGMTRETLYRIRSGKYNRQSHLQ